jgi:leucyl-tRNA synthetase
VNGKTRLSITIPKEIAGNANEIEKLVRESEAGRKWLSDKPIRKLIVAKKGELVNFVL